MINIQENGIGSSDVKKLVENGYTTVQSVAFSPRKALLLIKGLSEAKVDKILTEGKLELFGDPAFPI